MVTDGALAVRQRKPFSQLKALHLVDHQAERTCKHVSFSRLSQVFVHTVARKSLGDTSDGQPCDGKTTYGAFQFVSKLEFFP